MVQKASSPQLAQGKTELTDNKELSLILARAQSHRDERIQKNPLSQTKRKPRSHGFWGTSNPTPA
jgi:hypothetical protein